MNKRILSLRQDIDQIDKAIHDLLMERAELVHKIQDITLSVMEKDPEVTEIRKHFFFRPSRQYMILKRLLRSHSGVIPRSSIVRIWNEIFSAIIDPSKKNPIALFNPQRIADILYISRFSLGTGNKVDQSSNLNLTLKRTVSGEYYACVVPHDRDYSQDIPWWVYLCQPDYASLRVIAQLPFIKLPEEKNPLFMLSSIQYEYTGFEHSFVVFTTRKIIGHQHKFNMFCQNDLKEEFKPFASGWGGDQKFYFLLPIEGFHEDPSQVKALLPKHIQPHVQDIHIIGYANRQLS